MCLWIKTFITEKNVALNNLKKKLEKAKIFCPASYYEWKAIIWFPNNYDTTLWLYYIFSLKAQEVNSLLGIMKFLSLKLMIFLVGKHKNDKYLTFAVWAQYRTI